MSRDRPFREGPEARARRAFSERSARSGPSAGGLTREYQPHPGAGTRAAETRNQQAPLGAHPGYDDVLDVAVQYTFPCSDPIAVDDCCASAGDQSSFDADERPPGAGAEPQTTDTASRPR